MCLFLLMAAPLAGIWLQGKAPGDYLVFPPRTTYLSIEHAGFSWAGFLLILLAIILITGPFFLQVIRKQNQHHQSTWLNHGFPNWGWLGLILMLGGWFLAWSRLPFMRPLQPYTFTIPWLGYIILINAATFMRCGRSMITHQKKFLLVLFFTSAGFWWYFEYLNQFVENWYYVNVGPLSNWQFFGHATLAFSTVLPAVIGTRDLLRTFPAFSAGLDHFLPIALPHHRNISAALLVLSALALGMTPLFVDYLFPMLWLAPLVIMVCAQILAGEKTIFRGISTGNWKELYLLGMAALFCGFLWEMWNYHSLTRWEYAVPFVDRFHLFEMPVAGYAGYLPFGLQCGLVAAWLKRWF